MPTKKVLGERLKMFRLALAETVTSADFANKAGVNPSHYSKAERGIKGLGEDKLMELCAQWDIGHDWLYTGKGPMKESELKKYDRQPNSSVPDEMLSVNPEQIETDLLAISDAVKRIHDTLKAAQSAKLDIVYRKVETGIEDVKHTHGMD